MTYLLSLATVCSEASSGALGLPFSGYKSERYEKGRTGYEQGIAF